MFSSDKNFSSKAIIINILIKGTDKLSDPFLLVISERVEKKATIRINNNDWRYGTSLKKKLPKKRMIIVVDKKANVPTYVFLSYQTLKSRQELFLLPMCPAIESERASINKLRVMNILLSQKKKTIIE